MTTQSSHIRVLICSIALLMLASAIPASAKIKIANGPKTTEIQSFSKNGVEYLSLTELSRVIEGTVDWEIPGSQASYIVNGNRFEFNIESPYFKLNDSTYNLTYETQYRRGDLYLPAGTFLPFLDKISDQRITYDPRNLTVRLQDNPYNVTDIAFSEKANGMLIEIYLADQLSYDVFVTEGNWINVSIRNGKMNAAKIQSRLDPRILIELKAINDRGAGQISFQLRQNVKTTHHKLVPNPWRIQIAIPDVNFQIDSVAAPVEPTHAFDGTIDVIAVDAGHGGKDYGAIGPDRTREKDVTLAIARQLSDLIRQDGRFKVIMTRNSDDYVSLADRAEIANKAGADLFISIHANASPSRKARGWNVFFLAPAKNDSARAVEQLENSYFVREMQAAADSAESTATEGDNPVMGILNEMLMTEFQSESHDLAMMISDQFRDLLDIPARGVDQAGFFVLNKIFTPSVLVETAFISNRTEVKLLKNVDYQKKWASGIYEAIKQFAEKYDTPQTSQ